MALSNTSLKLAPDRIIWISYEKHRAVKLFDIPTFALVRVTDQTSSFAIQMDKAMRATRTEVTYETRITETTTAETRNWIGTYGWTLTTLTVQSHVN